MCLVAPESWSSPGLSLFRAAATAAISTASSPVDGAISVSTKITASAGEISSHSSESLSESQLDPPCFPFVLGLCEALGPGYAAMYAASAASSDMFALLLRAFPRVVLLTQAADEIPEMKWA
ncbi:hypothetical protein DFH09DRAFT_1292172 [Mycena vulgaris]|nr:hypothetical protein DFH09DRAFT_1292172 [Mycena vulgaris]